MPMRAVIHADPESGLSLHSPTKYLMQCVRQHPNWYRLVAVEPELVARYEKAAAEWVSVQRELDRVFAGATDPSSGEP